MRAAKVILFAALLLAGGGCGSRKPIPKPCEVCDRAKLKNGWCERCSLGYVAGVAIKSQLLFDTLDAHGHTLVLESFQCPTCKKAIIEDGFCEKCRIGWFKQQAYFSRLTYELAHGEMKDIATITCPVCIKNAEGYGWCDHCKAGMIGNCSIPSRTEYEAGIRGFELMLLANKTSVRCKGCAVAIITDTKCVLCNIAYKDGKPLSSAQKL